MAIWNLLNFSLKRTPLRHATYIGHLDMAKVLLQSGANINSQGEDKQTPLHIAALFGKNEIVSLLLDNGCDLNLKNKNRKTAEEIAGSKGFNEIVALITSKRMESHSLNQNTSSNNSSEIANDCKICFEKRNGIFAFLPCYHAVACEFCCSRVIRAAEQGEV